MSHPVPTSAKVIFRDLAIGDVIPIAHCTPQGKHTWAYVICGLDLVDGLIHLQLRCTGTGRTMHLVGAPESTTRRIPSQSAVCPACGQLIPQAALSPEATNEAGRNPTTSQGVSPTGHYCYRYDHVGVQRLLDQRPGAVVLDPGDHSLGLDLSTSLLATNPDAMLSAVRGVYRQLRQRLAESEEAGTWVWRGQPLAVIVFDLQACINGLTSYGQRRSLNLMVDVLFCMGPAMNIKVLRPAQPDEQPAIVWGGPHQAREVVAS